MEQRRSSLEDGGPREVEEFPVRRSYSIEAEDLLVETIFAGVLKRHRAGTYLDIGAAHPIQYSNTFHFYERGWSGLCVEPNPEFYAHYKTYRPRDRAFNLGLSPKTETLRYHRFESHLINGFLEQDLIDRHIASGEVYLGYSDVECSGVGDFLNHHIDGPIDFLNIDVELLDAKLLAAWDWAACRPSVICAEIHTVTIRSMLECDVATILERADYSAMSRGWLSTIFVANELIPTTL
jgi:FkbM family methyltransferase